MLLIVTAGFVSHACLCRDKAAFLWDYSPARWILYPRPFGLKTHLLVPLDAVFRRSFLLKSVPANARLCVRAFRACTIRLNGRQVPGPLDAEPWKRESGFEVGSLLRMGQNDLRVTVTNAQGPPALWLALLCPEAVLATDTSWEASLAGATWRPAALAADPVPFSNVDQDRLAEEVLPSVGKVWPVWLAFAAVSAVMVLVASRWLSGCLFRRHGKQEVASARRTTATPARSISSRKRKRMRQAQEGRDERRSGVPTRGQPAKTVEPLQQDPALSQRWIRLNWLLLALIAVFWTAMFLHNSPFLSPDMGFDSLEHLKYIDHFRAEWTVLLPGEIWESQQPPLYHVLAAVLLSITGYATKSAGGMLTIRLFNLVLAIGNLAVIWLALRLIFPQHPRRWALGLLMAGFLPMYVYMYQTPSNHLLGTTLASVTVYLTLRILSVPSAGTRDYLFLGLALGASLLSGILNGLLAPPLVLALAIRLYIDRARIRWSVAVLRLSLFAAAAFAVCGWFYLRVWVHFGTPIVGNTGSGAGAAWPWWQDPGFRTASDYLRFGESLRAPLLSVWYSIWDGLYSTLWGDSYIGGTSALNFRPPWSYDFLVAGMVLALLPTAAVALAAVCAVFQFLRKPTFVWIFLLALAYSVGLFLTYGPIMNPTYAAVKTFYGLAIAIPLCGLAAWGLDLLAGHSRWSRGLVFVILGVWALNVAATYWIWPAALETKRYTAKHAGQPKEQGGSDNVAEATRQLEKLLTQHPNDACTRALLARVCFSEETGRRCWEFLELQPGQQDTAVRHLLRGSLLAKQGRVKDGLKELQTARNLDPNNLKAAEVYYTVAHELSDIRTAIDICRNVLRINPEQIDFQATLSQLYQTTGNADLARLHQDYATRLAAAQRENETATVRKGSASK
jgi:tetratricopeptide (TPR) repeat protein